MTEGPYEILAGGYEDGRVSVKVQVDGRDVILIEEEQRGVRPEVHVLDASALGDEDRERALAEAWESYDDWSGEDARALLEVSE